ncbi:cytochrome c oxidase assembly protein PET191 [Pavlovales sp. CCMP2436]|nr:cytochrome c oxidase assembly protein PET191 [Pavlovales sp. CCMP2436]
MANSCTSMREDLLACLADGDCMKAGKSMEECMQLREKDGGCLAKRLLYMHCKRGQLDMRKRFKGNGPQVSAPTVNPS